MFNGIITSTQKPISVKRHRESIRLTVPIPQSWKLRVGDSVAIDGICFTVEKIDTTSFLVYAMAETLRRTTLKDLPDDHIFNLEQPLKLADFIGGHVVSGHVDTVATVKSTLNVEESRDVAFTIDKDFTKYLVDKGSVAVNGVSLTVTAVTDATFSVSLIPYTLSHTNLGSLKAGDKVNVELDMIAKQLEKLIKPYLKNRSVA